MLSRWLHTRPCLATVLRRTMITYVQGQSPAPNLREYFYYIDHQGQLFLDDTKMKNFVTCFKEKKFLKFFFRRLKQNEGKYKDDFPYVSACGPEMNYVRCDDVPVVFATIIHDPDEPTLSPGSLISRSGGREKKEPGNEFVNEQQKPSGLLTYSGIGEGLTFPFQPAKVCMLPESGRIYHPAPGKIGGVGLIKSSLAIEISPNFEYQHGTQQEQDPPSHFNWQGVCYSLDNSLWKIIESSEVLKLRKRTGLE